MVAELVCTDKDECVDAFLEFLDACHGLQLTAAAFAFHRHGDDAHGEDAFIFGQLGHDRGCTGACSATHTGGDKQHLGVVIQEGFDLVAAHLGSFTPDVGVVAGAEFTLAEVHGGLHTAFQQRLVVGVAQDEVDALDAFFHHVVDGIATAATHTDDFDIVGLFCVDELEHLAAIVDISVVFCHSCWIFKD